MRRRVDKRVLAVALLFCALALAWAALWLAMVASTLEPQMRAALLEVLGSRGALAALALLAVAAAAGWLAQRAVQRHVVPLVQLADALRVAAATEAPLALPPVHTPELAGLKEALQALGARLEAMRSDFATQLAEASARVEQERNRLAALVSELSQSVVVCNLDGRILLYNNRARLQFRALSATPSLAGGAELIGIGRSIYAALDQRLVSHALELLQRRIQRGVAQPTTHFVTTTRSGQLLRLHMAPVRGHAAPGVDEAAGGGEIVGFVLTMDNITRVAEEEARRERLVHQLTERIRGALGSMRRALDAWEAEAASPEDRLRAQGVVRQQLGEIGQQLAAFNEQSADVMRTRWPLEDVLGADLLAAAQRRMAARVRAEVLASETDDALWLKVDSFSIIQVLTYLSQRLVEEFEVKGVQLRLAAAGGGKAHLDVLWQGHAMSTETVMAWELDAMQTGAEGTPLTVRDVVVRHGGALWFERDRQRHLAFFRLALPMAEGQEQGDAALWVRHDSRPEYFDFDLFATTGSQAALADDCPLSSLVYTVFDTETTGLNPSAGDQIIQIGATRIVNGRLLRQECLDQLIDPGRPIPPHTIPIHGITPEMVAGKPRIADVLPVFHAFAADTVLVAHNAAFDLKFLAMQEKHTGLRFDQPVLDTLLLSAVVHPGQPSHRLEDIAQRLNVPVMGRHTALGDALVTAEVFLRLLPLLAQKGIHTLQQAREAARQTPYARLKY